MLELPLGAIHLDDDLQARASVDGETVTHYANALRDGSIFPAIVVANVDGKDNVLIDGWHRYMAHYDLRLPTIFSQHVGKMTYENALKYGITANAKHAKPFTAQDRRRACELLLRTNPALSDNAIGTLIGMAVGTVGRIRDAIGAHSDVRIVERGDSVYTVDVTNQFAQRTHDIIATHGVANPNTKALLDRLVKSDSQYASDIVDMIQASGHIALAEDSDDGIAITSDYDVIRQTVDDYKRLQTAIRLQATMQDDDAPVPIVPFDDELQASEDTRMIVIVQNKAFKRLSAWCVINTLRITGVSYSAPHDFFVAVVGDNRHDVRLPDVWQVSQLMFDIVWMKGD